MFNSFQPDIVAANNQNVTRCFCFLGVGVVQKISCKLLYAIVLTVINRCVHGQFIAFSTHTGNDAVSNVRKV